MGRAKDIEIKIINFALASSIVRRYHYSGNVVNNSQLHFGVYIGGKLEGALQFGPPIDRRNLLGLVKGAKWCDMLELNRMAFGPALPKNSESRALAVCMRLIKKHYPQIKWVVSFADGCQCGDGTIYRASGFLLTAINKNKTMYKLKTGEVKARHGTNKKVNYDGASLLAGFQFRYIYFIDKKSKDNLVVPVLDFSEIDNLGAGMYKGVKREKQAMAGSTSTAAGQHRPSRSNSGV